MDPKEEKLLEHYLARIGLPGPPPISEQGLFLAHMHQAFAIPFENISVYLGDSVSLSPESLVDKLVLRKRGGYCFELNGLLAWALRRFQFSLEAHLARVQVHNPRPGPLTHEILIAQLGTRRWLCDVGFGGPGLHHPMPFELGRIEHQGAMTSASPSTPTSATALSTSSPMAPGSHVTSSTQPACSPWIS